MHTGLIHTTHDHLRAEAALRAADQAPSPEELAQAPLLEGWCAAPFEGNYAQLVGVLDDHPTRGPITIRTEPVLAVDPDRQWARTLVRCYRLSGPYTTKVMAPHQHRAIPAKKLEAAVAKSRAVLQHELLHAMCAAA